MQYVNNKQTVEKQRTKIKRIGNILFWLNIIIPAGVCILEPAIITVYFMGFSNFFGIFFDKGAVGMVGRYLLLFPLKFGFGIALGANMRKNGTVNRILLGVYILWIALLLVPFVAEYFSLLFR